MASTTGWAEGLTGIGALHRLAPGPAAVLERLTRTIAARPEHVALVRATCASAHELPPLRPPQDLPRSTSVESLTDAGVVTRFAEQFSIDVSSLDDTQRADLWAALGESPRQARGRLLAMMWVADLVPRVLTTLDRLFGASGPLTEGTDQADEVVDDLTPLAHEFVRVVHTLHGVDAVLSDQIRLRGAQAHDCRLCKSLRSRTALAAGAAPDGFDGSGDPAAHGLPAASVAAMNLVDAMLWHPARIDEAVVERVRALFTSSQAVEIVLDVMRNAWNKTTVAAELDAAHVTGGIEVYEYRDDGTVQFGLGYADGMPAGRTTAENAAG